MLTAYANAFEHLTTILTPNIGFKRAFLVSTVVSTTLSISNMQNLKNLVGQIYSHFYRTAKSKFLLVFRISANHIYNQAMRHC